MPRKTRSAILGQYRLTERLSAESKMILDEILSTEERRKEQRRQRIRQIAQRKPSRES